MEIIIGMGIAGFLTLILGVKKLDRQRELMVIETQKESQLAIDAQRYEKIREILTDGIVDGQPAALEALKPLVEVVADQMRGDELIQLKQLEHKQQLALVAARNQPFQKWMDELRALRRNLANGDIEMEEFEQCIQAMATSTEKVFGISLQQALPAAEEKKSLPEATNNSQ